MRPRGALRMAAGAGMLVWMAAAGTADLGATGAAPGADSSARGAGQAGVGAGGAGATIAMASTGAAARQVYQRFQSLAGEWKGNSTKGWTDRATFRTIAGGSVVVESSEFSAHPDETMMTMVHLDGDRLMLTHYCIAKNQPRLQMTAAQDGGRKATFNFKDATNLPSPDKGHMHDAVFEFVDDDHFTSRWSFFKDGREEWMEEIHFERIR